MPEIDFDPMHKRVSSEALDFDRLKLKKEERARIVLLEKPTFAYVHTLRAPKLVNGRAHKVEKEDRKGNKYIDFDMDFVGRPLCLGDYGILADSAVDPANCPACKRSMDTDEVNPPERRFAMNVIRYGMSRDGQLVKPFKCDCLVWGYTEGIYNRLIDIAQEHGSLVGRDLLLGPCTNESFQKYEIQAGAQSLWQSSDAVKTTVQATYAENRVVDLERACGRKSEPRWMVKDLDSIAERWRVARGVSDGTEAAGSTALADGLSSLLGDDPKATQPAVDMATLLDAPAAAPPAAAAQPAPSPAEPVDSAPASTPPGSTRVFDFDSILEGLK